MAGQKRSNAFDSLSILSSSAASLKKYDVFLSFRGEDTRRNITTHLYDALSRKKVETFIDNNELKKGDEISPTLIKAIEESHLSIVIFSENYASSKWCLNELKKILECKRYKKQIVIPVFYNIDPSHVRNQTGIYKQAFEKHKRELKHNYDRLKIWKAALTEAASLVGWDFQNYRTESDFIKDIVKDALLKLNLKYQHEIKGLVGIEKNYEQIESMLKIGSNEVIVLGIWGMGGIGKTTLAKALYAKLHSQFEGCCFLNVMDESNKYGLDGVHSKFFSTLLEEENLHPDASYIESRFSMRRIARKKVFIVLDGVETLEKIEDLILEIDGLGPGSRVVVTTRDKHIFSLFSKCEIYEVQVLNKHDSLQLFSLTVFGQKHPEIGYEDLSERVIDYCKGNPLALKVIGANLRSRSNEAWVNELKKLEKIPNKKICDVLKLSFDDLDRCQKAIFLDIACFLREESKYFVIELLEACELFAISGIEVLLNKSLIQIKLIWLRLSNSEVDGLEMHDLLQKMGRDIVNQESKDPGKRSRLWKAEEICDVLKKNKGTEAVEAITFDRTEVGDLYLKSDSFKRMTNLRYLEIYNGSNGRACNVYFPDGLEWLSDKLRYFRWDAYCLESLPTTFCAEMLLELNLTRSKLKRLWDGVQNLVNLKIMMLEFSYDLIEIPDLSRATNLERLYLYSCESLCQLHPSILCLPRLEHLDLRSCIKIESLKTNFHSKSLYNLLLKGCSSLTEFSVTSEAMRHLSLNGTAIHELSSSIWRNTKLTILDLTECNKLNIVGSKLSNDHGLGSVRDLDLSGCTEINALNLLFILDGIWSLNRLKMNECCNLEGLPENIKKHSRLNWLELNNCRKLVSLAELPPSLLYLKAINCTYLDTNSSQQSLLENMVQTFSGDPLHVDEGDNHLSFLPGAQVPCQFDFQTTEASITIPPIPKSDLRGFIFCVILSEGFHALLHSLGSLHCIIFEHDKEVDRRHIFLNHLGTLISDHVLICWQYYNRQESGSYAFCNLSFRFVFLGQKDQMWWSTEGIKGCGVLPVYSLKHKLEVDGGSSVTNNIVDLKLKSTVQDSDDSDCNMKNEIKVRSSNNEKAIKHVYVRRGKRPRYVSRPPIKDDSDFNLQNEIEVRSSKNKNEDDQEQPSCSRKEGTTFFNRKKARTVDRSDRSVAEVNKIIQIRNDLRHLMRSTR
ncbi:TMV resistance protein N-like [Vicia villosa]|uniref:TMV resistance protein N-like n=1 Tax=Vicia villosa TaxID=3911 RepID=UPI00273ACD58|nr:TMV resistance protein N-like [Vicia villosa]XP_058788002.1 TMV resistance protein N-like [Vicia villosa]